MVIGCIAALGTVVPPLCVGCALLGDASYTFWLGWIYPIGLLSASLGTLLLFVVVCIMLHQRGASVELDERAFAWTAAAFAALLGALLVLLTIPGSRGLQATAEELAQGRTTTLAEAVILMDFMKVLYNIRTMPGCLPTEAQSVEECKGWGENKYTAYLRDLENEFDCGPLYGEPFAAPPPTAQAQLLQEATNPRRQHAAGEMRQVDIAGATVAADGAARFEEQEATRLRRQGHGRRQALLSADTVAAHSQNMTDGATEQRVSFRVGDKVMISRDPNKIQQAFKELPRYEWRDLMPDMAGRQFSVLAMRGPDMVGILSPDGSQNGVWFFPQWVLQKAQLTSLATAPKLFSEGSSYLACMPIVEARLRAYAWSFGDLLFWEGLCLIFVSLLIGASPLVATAMCGPMNGGSGTSAEIQTDKFSGPSWND